MFICFFKKRENYIDKIQRSELKDHEKTSKGQILIPFCIKTFLHKSNSIEMLRFVSVEDITEGFAHIQNLCLK